MIGSGTSIAPRSRVLLIAAPTRRRTIRAARLRFTASPSAISRRKSSFGPSTRTTSPRQSHVCPTDSDRTDAPDTPSKSVCDQEMTNVPLKPVPISLTACLLSFFITGSVAKANHPETPPREFSSETQPELHRAHDLAFGLLVELLAQPCHAVEDRAALGALPVHAAAQAGAVFGDGHTAARGQKLAVINIGDITAEDEGRAGPVLAHHAVTLPGYRFADHQLIPGERADGDIRTGADEILDPEARLGEGADAHRANGELAPHLEHAGGAKLVADLVLACGRAPLCRAHQAVQEVLKIPKPGLRSGDDKIAADRVFHRCAFEMRVQAEAQRPGERPVIGCGRADALRRYDLGVEAEFQQVAEPGWRLTLPAIGPDPARRDGAGAPAILGVADQIIGEGQPVADLVAAFGVRRSDQPDAKPKGDGKNTRHSARSR